MRWLNLTILLFTLVSSVISTEIDNKEPYLHIMARTSVYNAGETKAIYCKGRNLTAPIEWYTPSNTLVEERSTKNLRVYVEKRIDDPGDMVSLIIHNIKITDGGNWTCKSGDLTDNIEFIVGGYAGGCCVSISNLKTIEATQEAQLSREKVIIPDRNITVESEEGKSIKLNCEAKGHPVPVVTWYMDNSTPIPNDSKKYVIRNDNSLEIKKLNHADVGQYVCKVRQKALSHYTDKTVLLTVRHKPILYNNVTNKLYTAKFKTEEVYAILNETKNITCYAIANPLPTYRWYKRINSNYDDPITDEDTVVASEDGTYSLLVLRMRDESYLGEYKCTANNSRGEESIIFHVSLGAKPNPPDYVSLVSANVTELTFNVSCSTCPMELEEDVSPNPLNLTIQGYTFQFVPAQEEYSPDWENAFSFDLKIQNPNDTIFMVGPLPNNTKFHGHVRTRNAAGYSEWVDIVPDPNTTDHALNLMPTFFLTITAFLFTCWY